MYPGGHQPDLEQCPTCGGPCEHKDLLAPKRRGRKPSASSAIKPRRVVFYVPPKLYIAMLRAARGQDMSPWLNKIVEADSEVSEHLEKENEQ